MRANIFFLYLSSFHSISVLGLVLGMFYQRFESINERRIYEFQFVVSNLNQNMSLISNAKPLSHCRSHWIIFNYVFPFYSCHSLYLNNIQMILCVCVFFLLYLCTKTSAVNVITVIQRCGKLRKADTQLWLVMVVVLVLVENFVFMVRLDRMCIYIYTIETHFM